MPARIQSKPSASARRAAMPAAVRNVPSRPIERIGGGRAEPAPADVHAAVEEDHDQRHDRDPLDGLDRHAGRRAGARCPTSPRPRPGRSRARHRDALGEPRRERPRREKPPATTRTMMAKSVISVMASARRPDFPALRRRGYQPPVSAGGMRGPEAGRVRRRARPAPGRMPRPVKRRRGLIAAIRGNAAGSGAPWPDPRPCM